MNVLVTKYSSKDNGCKRASNKLAYVAQEQQLHVQQQQAYQHQEQQEHWKHLWWMQQQRSSYQIFKSSTNSFHFSSVTIRCHAQHSPQNCLFEHIHYLRHFVGIYLPTFNVNNWDAASERPLWAADSCDKQELMLSHGYLVMFMARGPIQDCPKTQVN